MYAYREMMTLTDPQRLVLRQPLPWLSGQTVEVLIVSEAVAADFPPIAVSAPTSWAEFLVERDDLLAKHADEVKALTLNRSSLGIPSSRDPFAGWVE